MLKARKRTIRHCLPRVLLVVMVLAVRAAAGLGAAVAVGAVAVVAFHLPVFLLRQVQDKWRRKFCCGPSGR